VLLDDPIVRGPVEALTRRLTQGADAPVIVAFSGGGDSLALLLIAQAWAQGADRRLIAVTIDHRLQSAGAAWARWCAERAARLGVEHRVLAWEGPKPTTGLPAAARAARHGLLAEAACGEGAAVILMGHTADDVLEAAAMRAVGSTTPSPRTWAPSPVWPQGRGFFVLRPLLGLRRAALRAWLTARGETWIEDPANDDLRFARARARRALVGAAHPACAIRDRLGGAEQVTAGAGDLVIPRAHLQMPGARNLLATLLVCASGAAGPPRGARLDRLVAKLAGEEPLIATLAGARLEGDARDVRVLREPGEFRRREAGATPLPADQPIVWDGRFEITAACEGLIVRPLGGLAARLPKVQAATLRTQHPLVRRTLPALVDPLGQVTCPVLAADSRARVRSLVLERFWAAAGLIEDEASIWRVAKAGVTS
jgi:tRNA(Ile)-lysidine synthase